MTSETLTAEQILDAVPSYIFLKDCENHVLRVNQAVLDTFGMERDEIEGQHSRHLFPEDFERFHQDDLEVIRSGKPRLGYVEPVRDRWVRTDKIPIRSSDGSFGNILVIATDVTETHQAQEKQRLAAALLERTGQIANVGGWELTLDPIAIKWSPQVCRIHGVPVGHQPDLTTAIEYYTPEWRPTIEEAVRQGMEEHRAWDMEAQMRRADGRLIWVRAIGEPDVVNGVCVRLWGTLQDITESVIARTRLHESEKRLDLALRNANVGLWDWDARTDKVYYSATTKTQLGYSEEEKWSSFDDWQSRIHPDDLAGALQRVNDYFKDREKSYESSFRLRTAEGAYRWIRALGRGSFDSEGLPVRVTGVHVDITEEVSQSQRLASLNQELQAQKEKLEQSNQDLAEFAYVASHDLKAPLRGIEHLTDWLTEDLGDSLPEKSQRHLEQLTQRVRRMGALLNDLLEYSRAGKHHGIEALVDVEKMLDQVAEILSLPEGFIVERQLGVDRVQTDPTPLETVLRNLISNAIKHHDRATGVIRVASEMTSDGSAIEFIVTDDGPGIPEDLRDRAFGMFQTLRPRDEVEGSGMGLALVKRWVEAAGGRVSIESALPRGAVVRFTWPITPIESADDKPSEP